MNAADAQQMHRKLHLRISRTLVLTIFSIFNSKSFIVDSYYRHHTLAKNVKKLHGYTI
jgi:hypothetical protein